MKKPEEPDPSSLAKHAAVCWIEEAIKEHLPVKRAIALASERHWGGKLYAPSTLEGWLYSMRKEGFGALCRTPRQDKGTRKALSPAACEALLQWRQKHPRIKVLSLGASTPPTGSPGAGHLQHAFGLPPLERAWPGPTFASKQPATSLRRPERPDQVLRVRPEQ